MKKLVLLLTVFIIVLQTFVVSNAADIPVVTVDNYNITITGADGIRDMRYAPGVYTMPYEIKGAEGNVALSESIVDRNTHDGIFTYEMPKGGYYTLWIRMDDGTNHIMPLDVTHFTPYISSYGVKITLHNLYDVKDFFIAEGKYQSYREIKDNGYIVSLTSNRIGNKHEYTYTVYKPGIHTILIRYNDGSQKIFYETLTVDEPVFTPNGLQMVVSNLPDVKVIRTAYGEWNTVKELKTADSIRNFSSKTAIKGQDPYTIQYRNEGRVTVIVEYNNGYVKVHHYDVRMKTPAVTQNNDTVTFTKLDGMVNLRYAKGEYSSSAEIKNAFGAVRVKADSVTFGTYSVTLTPGIYSFCVQYDDESYNYYVFNIGQTRTMSEGFAKQYSYTDSSGNSVTSLPYWLYTPENTEEKLPLVVVLHCSYLKINTSLSASENLDRLVSEKEKDITSYIYNDKLGNIPAYIIMPQITSASRGWAKRGDEIKGLVEYCVREYNIDENRISVIGYSMGGTGATELACAYPEIFDKAVSVAGGLDGVTNNNIPYVRGEGRYQLAEEYPELRIPASNATGFKREEMKYAYADGNSTCLTVTEEEKAAALRFEIMRTGMAADKLRNAGIPLWMIIGKDDSEVSPLVSERLFECLGEEYARLDEIEDCSHSGILNVFLERGGKIMEFLVN